AASTGRSSWPRGRSRAATRSPPPTSPPSGATSRRPAAASSPTRSRRLAASPARRSCRTRPCAGTSSICRPTSIAATSSCSSPSGAGCASRRPASRATRQRPATCPMLDARAHSPGDLLTVVVAEQSQGKKDATTETTGESSMSASVEDFFGIPAAAVKFLPNGFNPQSVVKAETKRSSKGDGTTTREGALTANITVRVVALDPNGNLYVRGDKIVSVNRENQHIVL